MVTSLFWERLAEFADAPFVVDAAGGITSYRDVARAAEAFAENLGPTRRLIFLEIDNTPGALIAYLGCLIGRHPVLLYGRGDAGKVPALVDHWRPNLVIGAKGEAAWHHRESLALHPHLAVLLSTSGSTGSSKLVKLSARNLDANARAIAQYLELGPSERAITLLKPHYSYGLSVIHSHLVSGASLILTDASVADAAFWQTFRRYGATSFAGVPYTFETLARRDVDLSAYPSFRYATQAGGRLAPELVRRFAKQAAAAGGRFVVMYGQTEAAPRMTYLPPAVAEAHPDSIGIPIPGGNIRLIDEHGRDTEHGPGEIVYQGPNVMMGYATGPAELATDETPEALHTGDIATRNGDGLLTIVGRAARFVKLFGKRINLDAVEAHLRRDGIAAACAGDDAGLVVAIEDGAPDLGLSLGEAFGLPSFAIQIERLDTVPRLASGKPDYPAILARQTRHCAEAETVPSIFSLRFVRQVGIEAATILGLTRPRWQSVADIFAQLVGPARSSDSFSSLQGDSMRFVQVSLALEDFLGTLPEGWEHLSIGDLERMRDGVL